MSAKDPLPLEPRRCSRLLKVLADSDRLRIIEVLRAGPLCVTDVAERLALTLAMASHHLRILRTSGFVEDAKQGRHVAYSLAPEFFPADQSAEPMIQLGCCQLQLPAARPRKPAGSRADRGR